eukprot:TRINITY_DN13427_c0_g2_i2.p1 TRINITY_DN13427_c0_g2~~TRINITY_DN13427_c0_g2_i2.p1  ORF type:complete len:211 (-),score=39.12 TRINITY_DN13427_c0_g2_i2:167-799(-)
MGNLSSCGDQSAGDKSIAVPEKITVYYWGPHPGVPFYGRAIAIYLTLDQAGVKYDMKPPSEAPEGVSFAPPSIDIDGMRMGQNPAILASLGEMFGLLGKSQKEKMQVLQAVEDMNDIFGEHGKFKENEGRKKQWFTYLEKKLQGKKWVGGTDEPTVADFHGVFAFEWIVSKAIDFSAFPNITKWWADIQAYPVVAKMKASRVDGRKHIPA